MATKGKTKKLPSKVNVPSRNNDIYRVPLDVVSPHKELGEDIMGWIAACILIAVLLPLLGFLYVDILEVKHESKTQLEKVEKLRRQIEQEKRKNDKT